MCLFRFFDWYDIHNPEIVPLSQKYFAKILCNHGIGRPIVSLHKSCVSMYYAYLRTVSLLLLLSFLFSFTFIVCVSLMDAQPKMKYGCAITFFHFLQNWPPTATLKFHKHITMILSLLPTLSSKNEYFSKIPSFWVWTELKWLELRLWMVTTSKSACLPVYEQAFYTSVWGVRSRDMLHIKN